MNNEVYIDDGFLFNYTKIEDLPEKFLLYKEKIILKNPNVDVIGFIVDKSTTINKWKVLLKFNGIVYYNSCVSNLTQRTQKFNVPYESTTIEYYIKKIHNPDTCNMDYVLNGDIDIEKSKIKIKLTCRECGWVWDYRLDNWLSECRYNIVCPFHNMQYINYTFSNFRKLIYRHEIPENIQIIDVIGDKNNINVKSKLHLKCSDCEHEWKSMSINKLIGGRACINCNNYGFKIHKDGFFYIHSITINESVVAYKIGITNNEPDIRCKQINRKSDYDHNIIFKFKSNGSYVLGLETHLKRHVNTKFLSSDKVGDGWSETISPDNIEKIHDIIVDYLIENE